MSRTHSGARSRLARRLSWLGVVSMIAVALLAPSTSPALAAAPGNNATVKIEDSVNPKPEPANDPHVCQFDIKFYFADPGQAGDWHIQSWPPTGDKTTVLEGTYDTNSQGFDRQPTSGYYSLPDGHYKLFWKGDEEKLWKHKVFWVECQPAPTETPKPTEKPKPTETVKPTETPTPTKTPCPPSETPKPTEKPKPTETTRVDPTPKPTGDVGPSSGKTNPPHATLPPTDTLDGVSSAPASDSWRIILLAMAGLLTAALMLTPARAARKQD